jgi:hypothetical protein
MNNDELKNLISGFFNKNGYNSAQTSDAKNKQKVEKLLNSLNDKQAVQLKEVLNNPEKSKEILNSSAARALLKKLSDNG